MPGIPSTPSAVEGGAGPRGTWRRVAGLAAAYSCQPLKPSTRSPGLNPSACDSTTSLTVPPVITSPMPTGAE